MGNLVTLLIGHRGTGKSALLKRLADRHPQVATFDLDSEIAHSTGESVSAIFARSEPEFRAHERRVLNELISTPGAKVIALGAGFEGPLPAEAHVVWVRRATDAGGRVFTGRPRLNPNVSLYEEYMERFPQREERYRLWAHEVLTVPEGDESALSEDAWDLSDFLWSPRWNLRADLTLLPEDFRAWRPFWGKRYFWDLRYLEVREDLLRPDQMERALTDIPADKIIYACRDTTVMPEAYKCDWPLEKGAPPRRPFILSLHARDQEWSRCLEELTSHPAEIYKLAVEIRDFHELELGHKWWLEDPEHRAFLPRSVDGRWRWYRSLFGPRMPLHYIREGQGSALDQPYLWQSVLQPVLGKNFAAVLGNPVEHSRSPREHQAFFKNTPFVTVEVREEEFAQALPVLQRLGLKYAAVTSPLKRVAFAACETLSSEAESLRTVNTLFHDGVIWHGHNTDYLALKQIRSQLPELASVWLWGGGGIKSSVKRVWPEAREISARAGVTAETSESPALVIWATGRSREFQWPPEHVQPQLILDLNYGENSPGLEWAVRSNLPYQSGLRMFKLQAEAQRIYWRARSEDV
ncbi:MAG: hypothetical protein KF799_04920 [Bdellovibrionales bacterium]|nr:hypothetical protein [Bdellovibrionales bacterium]